MASEDIVNLVVTCATDTFTYMLPLIGFMAGLSFIVHWLMYITVGIGGKVFKG